MRCLATESCGSSRAIAFVAHQSSAVVLADGSRDAEAITDPRDRGGESARRGCSIFQAEVTDVADGPLTQPAESSYLDRRENGPQSARNS